MEGLFRRNGDAAKSLMLMRRVVDGSSLEKVVREECLSCIDVCQAIKVELGARVHL